MLMREVGSPGDVRARPARAFDAAPRGARVLDRLGSGLSGPACRADAGGDGGIPGDVAGDHDMDPAQQGDRAGSPRLPGAAVRPAGQGGRSLCRGRPRGGRGPAHRHRRRSAARSRPPGQAGHHQRPVGVIAVRAQVDRRGMLAGVQVGQPICAQADPADLIGWAVADQVAPVQLGVVVPAAVFGAGQPAARSSPRAASSSSRSASAAI